MHLSLCTCYLSPTKHLTGFIFTVESHQNFHPSKFCAMQYIMNGHFINYYGLSFKMVFLPLQVLNLLQAFENNYTPQQLVQMPPIMVERIQSNKRGKFINRLRVRKNAPFFSWC